jgi:glutamine cyclotransferase
VSKQRKSRSEKPEAPAAVAPLAPHAQPQTRGFSWSLTSLAVLVLSVGAYLLFRTDSTPVSADGEAPAASSKLVEQLYPRVHARYPHDRRAFTQGLLWAHGRMFESTGLNGRSSLREVDLKSGEVLRRIDNDSSVFAEGLALVDRRLIQLTWREHKAYAWNLADFSQQKEFSYPTEGWGLCYDGHDLFMSDGSATLFVRDAQTFALKKQLTVTRNGEPQPMLNELECVEGKVFANVWQTDEIVRIDAKSGVVDGVIDGANLLGPSERSGVDVLNGIAYVPETGHFLVTGKLWPFVFEVTFEKR